MAGSARPPKKMKASKRLLRIFAGSGAGRAGTRPDRPRSRACASLTPNLPSLRSGRARLASSAGATGRASACSRTTKSGDELRGVRIRLIIRSGTRRFSGASQKTEIARYAAFRVLSVLYVPVSKDDPV
jgi:hypothetical protein